MGIQEVMYLSVRHRIAIKYSLASAFFVILVIGISFYIGREVVHPGNIRTFLGYSIILLTVAISIKKPTASITLVLIFLPLLGLIRRILIPIAGWGSFDPLVLVGPICSLLLGSSWFYRRLFLREEIRDDTPVFRLGRLLLLIDMLEVVNPRQGSPMVGVGGIMYYVVPLFWMVIGRTIVNEKFMKRVMVITFAMGVIAGAYGLKQTFYGFYPFEQQWISIVRITALHVGNQYRALGTTDNPQEYAEFLAESIVIGWIYVLRGNWLVKIFSFFGGTIIGYALFMESARGPLILAAVAIAVVTVLCVSSIPGKVITGLVVGAVLAGLIVLVSHSQSNNALVAHQIAGISGQDSTLQGHTGTMFSGIWRGMKSVIGYGLGSTTTAATKFASSNGGTEVDISNMFVSDGIVGGTVYIILLVRILILAISQTARRSVITLFAVGALLATFEQSINGELYAVTAVLWMVIGYVDVQSIAGYNARQSAYATRIHPMMVLNSPTQR